MQKDTELDGRLYRWDISLIGVDGAPALSHLFVNRGENSLWLPVENPPAYRLDYEKRQIVMSYGYFEDIYGSHRESYMLPPMKEVGPQEQYSWVLGNGKILEAVTVNQFEPVVRSRVSLKSLPHSRVRGKQPLDEYVAESTIVKSDKLKR